MSPKFVLSVAAISLAVVVVHQHVTAAGGVKNAARIGN